MITSYPKKEVSTTELTANNYEIIDESLFFWLFQGDFMLKILQIIDKY